MSEEQIKAICKVFDDVFGKVQKPQNNPPKWVDFDTYDKWAQESGEEENHEWHRECYVEESGISHGVLYFDNPNGGYLSIDYTVTAGKSWDAGDPDSGISSGWVYDGERDVIIEDITYSDGGNYTMDESQIDYDKIIAYITKHTGI